MQHSKAYEREISLRDLFFHILYKWRSIVIAALIGAVLLGGYAYISNRSKPAKTAVPAAADTESTEEPSFLQANYAASSSLYQGLLENNQNYRESSVVMRIDPYQVWKATTLYTVVLDDAESGPDKTYDPAVSIAATYPSLIYDNLDNEKLKAIYGDIDLCYINEVVSAKVISNAASFNLTVIGLTEEMAKEGQDYFEEVIRKASQGDIQQMGRHTVIRLSRYVRQAVDTDIESRQAAVAKNIATYQAAITSNESSVSKVATATKKTGKVSKKPGMKYAAAGVAAGAILLICLYAAAYLLSGKLRDAKELTERYDVPLYGKLNHSRARRPGKGVDRLIEKWEFRKTKADSGTVYDNVCALIREQAEGGRILLTGTISEERIRAVADGLAERLGETVQITAEGAFLNNSRAIAEAGQAAAVIITEAQHESETEDIRRMTEVLRLGKTPVTGAIAV